MLSNAPVYDLSPPFQLVVNDLNHLGILEMTAVANDSTPPCGPSSTVAFHYAGSSSKGKLTTFFNRSDR